MRIPGELAATLAVVVERGSLEAGAQALHVTQSAVTQRLQTLERTVGQVLLVRSRPVRATTAGEAVIRYARQVQHLDRELGDVLGVGPHRRAAVAIAVNGDSLATWFMDPLATVTETGEVTLELHRADEDRTADLLLDGTVAAAVTTRSTPVPGCTVTRLGDMTYRALASPEFAARWFPSGAIPTALAFAPVVDVDASDLLQTRYLVERGIDPAAPPRHRIPGSVEMARAVGRGMGWAVLPTGMGELTAGLVDLGGPAVTVPLHWQQWRIRSELLDSITAAVAGAAAQSLSR